MSSKEMSWNKFETFELFEASAIRSRTNQIADATMHRVKKFKSAFVIVHPKNEL